MSDSPRDRPDVVAFPPLIPVVTLMLSGLLQWLIPIGVLAATSQGLRTAAGAIFGVAGILVTVEGRLSLMRRGTNVNPLQPTLALATDGIYRWIRNPMYVGILSALLGVALIFALDWLPVLMMPAAVLLHVGIVGREEQYLTPKIRQRIQALQKAGAALRAARRRIASPMI
jgi:protein-S-isoprenylcysteine O-methyltransferase Ste14